MKTLIAMTSLQMLDTVITLCGGLGNEANPLVVRFGFVPFVTAKIVSIGLFAIAYKASDGLPKATRILNIAAAILVMFLVLGNGWNLLVM